MSDIEIKASLPSTKAEISSPKPIFLAPGSRLNLEGAWYALTILCIVTLIAQIDRNITPLIVTPLKKEFVISDTQFALLHGYGFAFTYAMFGLPFGSLVDRHNRRNIILIGLASWSLLTALSGFAGSYIQLLLLRTGVGIGEAVLAPAAYSLLMDFFEPGKRGRAVGIYYMAMAVGGGASMFAGALLLGMLPAAGLNFGAIVSLEPWRLLFLCAGMPGIFACLLIWTIKEPKRRGGVEGTSASIRNFLSYIWNHKALLARISIASTLMATAGSALLGWMPTLLERKFQIVPASGGIAIGVALIVGSVAGTLLSGTLSDRLHKGCVPDSRTRPMLLAYFILLPTALVGLVHQPWLSILLFCACMFSVAVVQSAMPLALQEAVPADMRGKVIALQYIILGLCSFGLGPLLVGAVNESISRSGEMLGYSLFVVMFPVALLGIALCYFGLNSRTYAQLSVG
ncbi:MFS transporter [Rhizorhabdus argentea]|uniref:MFS transporter n=1 Tax=Rhizorhabdus argentea TaxID=1387174 RepID=UPI0030EF6E14